jgi:hypothetical protein
MLPRRTITGMQREWCRAHCAISYSGVSEKIGETDRKLVQNKEALGALCFTRSLIT